jgi:hypothetical protein
MWAGSRTIDTDLSRTGFTTPVNSFRYHGIEEPPFGGARADKRRHDAPAIAFAIG